MFNSKEELNTIFFSRARSENGIGRGGLAGTVTVGNLGSPLTRRQGTRLRRQEKILIRAPTESFPNSALTLLCIPPVLLLPPTLVLAKPPAHSGLI